jgi:hypothetical protein
MIKKRFIKLWGKQLAPVLKIAKHELHFLVPFIGHIEIEEIGYSLFYGENSIFFYRKYIIH